MDNAVPMNKYLPANQGLRRWDPKHVKFGNNNYQRERYYAFLKHRSQARFKGLDYTLTWEDWDQIWCKDSWANRGRAMTNYVLGRIDWAKGFHANNVRIMDRKEHFEIRKRFYAK